jgi:superfamily II DNA/RNA helicase
VINYDRPDDPEIYVHRIGRTARAGRDGIAWSFVTPEQGALLSAIERLTNVEIVQKRYENFQPGPVPQDVAAQRELAAQRREATNVEHRRTLTAPPPPDEAADSARFPGGVVPVAMPGNRMKGRLRIRRR